MACGMHIEVTALLEYINGCLKYKCLLHGCLQCLPDNARIYFLLL